MVLILKKPSILEEHQKDLFIRRDVGADEEVVNRVLAAYDSSMGVRHICLYRADCVGVGTSILQE